MVGDYVSSVNGHCQSACMLRELRSLKQHLRITVMRKPGLQGTSFSYKKTASESKAAFDRSEAIAKVFAIFFCESSSKKLDFAHRLDAAARLRSRGLRAFKIPAS